MIMLREFLDRFRPLGSVIPYVLCAMLLRVISLCLYKSRPFIGQTHGAIDWDQTSPQSTPSHCMCERGGPIATLLAIVPLMCHPFADAFLALVRMALEHPDQALGMLISYFTTLL